MEKITVIGVGPGRQSCMTIEAAQAIEGAETVFAAARHAHLAGEKHASLEPLNAAMEDIHKRRMNGERVSVLLSGDASLYSMLPMLVRRFGADNLRVLPGVGALQALCAALCEPWQDAAILSAHGRPLSTAALAHAVRTHERVFLFCDASHGPDWACDALSRCGLGTVEAAVGERLSSPEERIIIGLADELRGKSFAPLSIVRFLNPAPLKALPPIGIADDAFERGKTPMTKREVRALAVSALRLCKDAVIWDIGAGTGSVSIECALQCPLGQVFSIERDTDALALIQRNAEKFFTENLTAVHGKAPEALDGLPTPTHVFLGGSGGELDTILDFLERAGTPFRLVATAVTLENAHSMIGRLLRWKGLEAAQVAVSRLEPVGGYHMFRAQNPVFILSADWEGKQ